MIKQHISTRSELRRLSGSVNAGFHLDSGRKGRLRRHSIAWGDPMQSRGCAAHAVERMLVSSSDRCPAQQHTQTPAYMHAPVQLGPGHLTCDAAAGLQSARISVKLASAQPDSLDASLREELTRLVGSGLSQQSMTGAVYPGCLHLVLQSLVQASPVLT